MLDPGDPAPDFDLPRPAAQGSETYRLSAAAREGPVVLAFYPLADAASAAGLVSDLAGVDWASVADRVAVLGVGVGEHGTHDRLADTVDAPFPLLVDRDGYFAEHYGVLEPVGEDTVRARRALFVVDGDCAVQYAWCEGGVNESPPLSAVSAAVGSL